MFPGLRITMKPTVIAFSLQDKFVKKITIYRIFELNVSVSLRGSDKLSKHLLPFSKNSSKGDNNNEF